jgi:tRNA(fMet)-specific endonuclease VapC
MRGWLSYLARTRSIQSQVEAYKRLKKQLENYCAIAVLKKVRYIRGGQCPVWPMPYALCPVVPHLSEKGYISVIEFDEKSATEFQRLKKLYPRLGSMDLKIAAIAIANDAILLTHNLTDFGQIQELRAEDWTV